MATPFETQQKFDELVSAMTSVLIGDEDLDVSVDGVTKASLDKRIKQRFAPIYAVAQGYVPYETKSELIAAGAPDPIHMGFVWRDGTINNNGLYGWDAVSSSWVKSAYDADEAFLAFVTQMGIKLSAVDGLTRGINADIFPSLTWIKGFWQTGTGASVPNGSDIGYNIGQYTWYTRFEITDYESVTITGAYSGAASTATLRYDGINVYGDGALVYYISNASGTNTVYLSDYAQYSNVELVVQCRNTANIPEFEGACVINVYQERFIRDNDLSTERSRLDQLELIANGIDSDIFSKLSWVKGWWQVGDDAVVPNGSNVGYNAGQYSWYSRLDITKYQYVTITGAYNGRPASTATKIYPGIAVYGDGALVYYISNASGTNTVYLSDYAQYSNVELVVQCRNTANIPEFEGACVVRAFRNPAPEDQQKPKRLVMVGDSLLGHDSAAVIKFMNRILAQNGYDPVIKRAQGGENIIGNLTRSGGLGVRVLSDFTLPGAVGGSVNFELGSAWIKSDGTYANTPYTGFPRDQYVVFNGIKGGLTIQSSDIVAIAFYDSSQSLISTETETGSYTAPVNSAYARYSIANPSSGVPHVTIADVAVDIDATATIAGYVNTSGLVVADAGYLCSDFISIAAGDSVYFDSLAVGAGYTFTRVSDVSAGENLNVSSGHIAFDTAVDDDSDYPHIWFTGQNGGYEDERDWGEMIESGARNLGDNFIVCSTALERTTPALVREGTKRFGRKYLNFRAYLSGPATSDAIALGLVPSGTTKDDWLTTFWNLGDSIHQNDIGSVVMAAKMWNLLLELGYVEGGAVGPDASDVDWIAIFSDVSV
jgi:hypothetical protein